MKISTLAYRSITVLMIGIGLLMVTTSTFAQGVGIGEADFTPNDKAILELKATTKGYLPPRMTQVDRDAINGLDASDIGLTVYQTDGMAGRYVWTGSVWTVMDATPVGAVQGFMTEQDPEKTGWAPMSANSTVKATQFPAFAALIGTVTNLGTNANGTITITDLNTDKRFIRGGDVAGIEQDQGTAPNGLTNVDVYVSHFDKFEDGGNRNGRGFTIPREDNDPNGIIKNNPFKARVGGEDENDPMYFTQDIHPFGPFDSRSNTETRPINYSMIWHVYVGLPVN